MFTQIKIISRERFFERFIRLNAAGEDFKNDPRSGKPSSARNLDRVENDREMENRLRRINLKIRAVSPAY
jgi:hypothetical protein